MTEPSNLRNAAEVARLIAATLGYEFDHAFRDKAEWIKERGEKGGRFHDVNEPYQTDFMYAAEEVTKAVEAETVAKIVAWLREHFGFDDDRADAIEALEAENERLREALGLADAALRGANMNMNVVERKLRAALEARHD